MLDNGNIKDRIVNSWEVSMTFCANCKTCPSVLMTLENDEVTVGGEDEGYTHFTKAQFKLFIEEAKSGTFDKILADVDITCESPTRTGGLSPDTGPRF